MEREGRNGRLVTEVSGAPSVSIMESKRQISDIEMAIDSYGEDQNNTLLGIRNRQISSGVIIDWKQFEDNEKVKSQLLLKDGENEEKVIFSYVVEEWIKQEPVKVIYRWLKKSLKIHNQANSQAPYPTEEEHVYRGPMKHFRKHGQGLYIIVKRYSDNSEKMKSIKGEWHQDILRTGVMTDQTGKQQVLSSNILKLDIHSHKKITPYLQKNQAIEQIRKKSMQMIPSGKNLACNSSNSIKANNKLCLV